MIRLRPKHYAWLKSAAVRMGLLAEKQSAERGTNNQPTPPGPNGPKRTSVAWRSVMGCRHATRGRGVLVVETDGTVRFHPEALHTARDAAHAGVDLNTIGLRALLARRLKSHWSAAFRQSQHRQNRSLAIDGARVCFAVAQQHRALGSSVLIGYKSSSNDTVCYEEFFFRPVAPADVATWCEGLGLPAPTANELRAVKQWQKAARRTVGLADAIMALAATGAVFAAAWSVSMAAAWSQGALGMAVITSVGLVALWTSIGLVNGATHGFGYR